MSFKLQRHPILHRPRGPLVIAVLDGVGIGLGDESDAVALARTPTLDALMAGSLYGSLFAHGPHVGLPDDTDMGNSEVGHNALGSGQVYDQGAKLVNRAVADGSLFAAKPWRDLMTRAGAGGAVHFLGLLSDGNVHSHIDHLIALLRRAASDGARRLFVHALLDGRDVGGQTALVYIDKLELVLAELRATGVDARIASGGGRMVTTMDRYQADWSIVERGWQAHVHGNARRFTSARAAVETFRGEDPAISDQVLPAFVVEENSKPVGPMASGDACVLFNFRGDRAIEISQAFDDEEFSHFDRGQRPDVLFMGMMEYDGDLHVPKHYLVQPPAIERTTGEYFAKNGLRQLAISETQKFGHVTYFWNGNRSGKFDEALETYIEIPSDLTPFENRPWMKAADITDRLIAELQVGEYGFARVNYANGDMVGHTGDLFATIVAMEVVDMQVRRLMNCVKQLGGILIVTADHGNADEMYFHDKNGQILLDAKSAPMVRPSHSLNRVPFAIYDPQYTGQYTLNHELMANASIANVAAVCYELLGFVSPQGIEPSLLSLR